MLLADTTDLILQGTTGAIVPQAFTRGYDAAAPPDEFPRAQCLEVMDERVCPLCAHLDGMIFDRGSPAYARYRLPSHINCRRIWAFIHRDEVGPDGRPTEPDFLPPAQELIDKHGHFVADEKKYAALRVPARPTGRDFIVFRPRLPDGGQARGVVLRWRDNLPNGPLQETLQTMAEGLADPLGLSHPGDRELALQILHHAAARGLFSDLTAIHARAVADWPAAALTREEVASVPSRLQDQGAALLTDATAAGSPEWVLHHPSLVLDAERNLDDVVALYDPGAAEFTAIRRLPPEPTPDRSQP